MFFKCLLVAAVAASLAPSPALAADQPVATAYFGCGIVVTSAGNLFVSGAPVPCGHPQSPWLLLANVCVSAGRPPGTIVGMTSQDGHVLAANGDWFQLGIDYNYCSGISATYQGNVFQITGTGFGETFLTIGGAGYEYAVTNTGDVFRFGGCDGWQFVGGLTGPTPAVQASLGSLRVHYR